MSDKKELDEYILFDNLNQYLETRIETSRSIVSIKKHREGPLLPRQERYRFVPYDCHEIKVIVSNVATTEPRCPAVVFIGLVLFINFKENEDMILQRWRDSNLPIVNLKNAPQFVESPKILPWNYFPRGHGQYFPVITEDERRQGYFLLPGQSISYEMNVLLSECLNINDMKLKVEANISRRHLYHCQKEIIITG